MPKFRKKPVEIEAWLWDESKTTFAEIGCLSMSSEGHSRHPDLLKNLRIETLEGTMSVNKGDYIIKGIAGEFYPCKPEIFEQSYEAAEPSMTKNKYLREIKPGVFVDVYDVLKAYEITCPAMQHAVKKCLAAGQRGVKDSVQDMKEAIASIDRSIELEQENRQQP